jgi:hypothetical protein
MIAESVGIAHIAAQHINRLVPGRIEQTLFAHPASACPRYVRALLLRCAKAFF